MTSRFILNLMVALSVLVGLGVCASVSTAETVTFQDGALIPTEAGGNGSDLYDGTTDLHLRQGVKSDQSALYYEYNTGGEINVVVGQYSEGGDQSGTNTDSNTRPLINFTYGTLADYMQANNLQIQSATLQMYLNGHIGSSSNTTEGQTVDLFKGLTAFNEGTGSSTGGRDGRKAVTGESCLMYTSYNTVNWAGGSYHTSADWSTAALDTGIVLSPAKYDTWIDFDVTGAYAADGSDLGDQDGFCMLARVDVGNPYEDGTVGGGQMLFNSSNATDHLPILTFVLAPVPEPSTFVLAGFGLLGLLAYAWRKRK